MFALAVTLKDIAALAGVSPSTVSRTCKDNPSISRETKERVRRAMVQLGYEPAFPAAQPPAETNHRMIGIILPPSSRETYENPFYLEVIRGISQFCNEHQYLSAVVTGQDDAEILSAIRDMVRREQADGFVLLYSRRDDAIAEHLYNEGLLYVLIGKAYQYPNQTIYINNDNFMAGQEAAEYLISLGHRRIGYVGSASSLFFAADRMAGYQMALRQHEIPVQSELCVEVPRVPPEDISPIRVLLEREDRPTAILVSDDILALMLVQLCRQMGLSIPQDVSILSFNDSLFARLSVPQLSSIDVNSFQLGIEAASQLINHIENPNLLAAKIIVPYSLVERDSCRRL
ncbi:MAG: LacI family DNA-binding transcriptional regulator [Faecalibacterium sp.]